MILDPNFALKLAQNMLEVEAVQLQPRSPFTWASGWKSPIYCDNRILLSYPTIRDLIAQGLQEIYSKRAQDSQAVAGVATGGIAHGLLLADRASLPFCYVRSKPKEHGKKQQIDGRLQKGQKVLVVEDLVSTGGSSLKAVDALRDEGAVVEHMAAIFTYDFPQARAAFSRAGVQLHTLSDYPTLLKAALSMGTITQEQEKVLEQWRSAPADWAP